MCESSREDALRDLGACGLSRDVGGMFGYTREHNRWNRTARCPLCRRFTGLPDARDSNGKSISLLTRAWQMDKQATLTCRKCGGSWHIFEDARTSSASTPTVDVIETSRTEESLGDEIRQIDNSASDVASIRRLRASRRWHRKYEVQFERSEKSGGGLDLSAAAMVSLKLTTEAAVRKSYLISEEEEEVFEEEVEVSVPGRSAVQIRLRWKRIWQHGVAVVASPSGSFVRVPFRVVAGLTLIKTL
jgi:hypothetical protein